VDVQMGKCADVRMRRCADGKMIYDFKIFKQSAYQHIRTSKTHLHIK